ncbi:nucleotidyltransferase family protein [uncultured Bacteroides sp.]|uniref:nucleotidyltransferase family protein n=1 Tax=uncultured Bacteroides sp. TaxID=162156 RepID=UPI0025ED2777|nr:nucleotidyltransferase family protein [uncultured Bacteroides sp.]
MRTKDEYIAILNQCATVLHTRFGVSSLRLFGSVAREEQKETSDVDICVEMKPNLFLRIELKKYLEEQLGCPVDVVRMHSNMNDFLRKQIEQDGIYVLS